VCSHFGRFINQHNVVVFDRVMMLVVIWYLSPSLASLPQMLQRDHQKAFIITAINKDASGMPSLSRGLIAS